MHFSKRLELSEKVIEWFDQADKITEPGHAKISRSVLGVVTALHALGYLRDPGNTEKVQTFGRYWRCNQCGKWGFGKQHTCNL